jgi:phosphate transport system substrate-binding protein
MVLSTQGQQVVVKDGYIPLPVKVADKALASIGIVNNSRQVSATK